MNKPTYLKVVRDIAREQARVFRFGVERVRIEPIRRDVYKSHQNQSDYKIENYFPQSRLLFLHIPKTAGSSVHTMLSTLESEQQIDSSIKFPERPSVPQHGRAWNWRLELGESEWRRLFKFTFVRNPWDLMVSCYFWWLQKAMAFPNMLHNHLDIRAMDSFDKFIESDLGCYYLVEHAGSPADWYASNGRDIVDFIGRFETFADDMRHVVAQVGIDPTRLQIRHDNATKRRGYREYYSERSRALVAARFADVIERFGYTF